MNFQFPPLLFKIVCTHLMGFYEYSTPYYFSFAKSIQQFINNTKMVNTCLSNRQRKFIRNAQNWISFFLNIGKTMNFTEDKKRKQQNEICELTKTRVKWHECQIFAASRMQQLSKNAKEIAANQSNGKHWKYFEKLLRKVQQMESTIGWKSLNFTLWNVITRDTQTKAMQINIWDELKSFNSLKRPAKSEKHLSEKANRAIFYQPKMIILQV